MRIVRNVMKISKIMHTNLHHKQSFQYDHHVRTRLNFLKMISRHLLGYKTLMNSNHMVIEYEQSY